MKSIVIRVVSEAQMRRVIESAERRGVTVYHTDDVPEDMLPDNLEFLGYVFVRGEKKDLLAFAQHVEAVEYASKHLHKRFKV